MFTDTQPTPLDSPVAAGARAKRVKDGHLCVDERAAVVELLRALRDGSVPISLITPAGAAMRTVLWSYDSEQARMALNADEQHPQLQNLVEADEVVAVAYLDNVKVQFDLHGLTLVRGTGACTLQAAMPRSVHRFQRRDSFRVRPNGRGPMVRMRHPSMPDMALALRVLDLSIGGCALLLPCDTPPIAAGTQLAGVRVELDIDTRFSTGLVLQHVTSLAQGEGTRLGCEWQQIDAVSQRVLQRFIDLTQRRRRLLSV